MNCVFCLVFCVLSFLFFFLFLVPACPKPPEKRCLRKEPVPPATEVEVPNLFFLFFVQNLSFFVRTLKTPLAGWVLSRFSLLLVEMCPNQNISTWLYPFAPLPFSLSSGFSPPSLPFQRPPHNCTVTPGCAFLGVKVFWPWSFSHPPGTKNPRTLLDFAQYASSVLETNFVFFLFFSFPFFRSSDWVPRLLQRTSPRAKLTTTRARGWFLVQQCFFFGFLNFFLWVLMCWRFWFWVKNPMMFPTP